MRRRDLLVLFCGLAVGTESALAQKTGVPRIGFVSSRSADESGPLLTGFRQGLSDNGFVEGQTVEIEYRWAENKYERLAYLANDRLGRQVAVIVAAGGPASAFAANAATTTITIVFTSVSDPVEIGLVASLSHPGGNITGTDATLTTELDAKRLELLHELLPEIRSVAAFINPTRPGSEGQTKQTPSCGARSWNRCDRFRCEPGGRHRHCIQQTCSAGVESTACRLGPIFRQPP